MEAAANMDNWLDVPSLAGQYPVALSAAAVVQIRHIFSRLFYVVPEMPCLASQDLQLWLSMPAAASKSSAGLLQLLMRTSGRSAEQLGGSLMLYKHIVMSIPH